MKKKTATRCFPISARCAASPGRKLKLHFRAKETIEGTVADLIKGGLVVDIGVRAFLPASQVDIRPQSNLESWKGQKILSAC